MGQNMGGTLRGYTNFFLTTRGGRLKMKYFDANRHGNAPPPGSVNQRSTQAKWDDRMRDAGCPPYLGA